MGHIILFVLLVPIYLSCGLSLGPISEIDYLCSKRSKAKFFKRLKDTLLYYKIFIKILRLWGLAFEYLKNTYKSLYCIYLKRECHYKEKEGEGFCIMYLWLHTEQNIFQKRQVSSRFMYLVDSFFGMPNDSLVQ